MSKFYVIPRVIKLEMGFSQKSNLVQITDKKTVRW